MSSALSCSCWHGTDLTVTSCSTAREKAQLHEGVCLQDGEVGRGRGVAELGQALPQASPEPMSTEKKEREREREGKRVCASAPFKEALARIVLLRAQGTRHCCKLGINFGVWQLRIVWGLI